MVDELQHTLNESVQEGVFRLQRTWPSLLATGFVGGLDVSVGVFAMLLVKAQGGTDLAAALAFSIGFIALTLAGSELFTENFLMPVTAVVIGAATWREVGRLWVGTATMNVVGGLVMVFLVMTAFPDLGEAAADSGTHFIELGPGVESLLSAILAGIVITLMTWMQLRKPIGARIVAAVAAGFVLNYGQLNHVVVASLEIFAGMFSPGAAYGVGEWVPLFALMAFGNMLGGIGLVTLSRLVQVGGARVKQEREETAARERESPRGVLLDKDPRPLAERDEAPAAEQGHAADEGPAAGEGSEPNGVIRPTD